MSSHVTTDNDKQAGERKKEKEPRKLRNEEPAAGAVNNSSLSGFTHSCTSMTLTPLLDLKAIGWRITKERLNRYWPL